MSLVQTPDCLENTGEYPFLENLYEAQVSLETEIQNRTRIEKFESHSYSEPIDDKQVLNFCALFIFHVFRFAMVTPIVHR